MMLWRANHTSEKQKHCQWSSLRIDFKCTSIRQCIYCVISPFPGNIKYNTLLQTTLKRNIAVWLQIQQHKHTHFDPSLSFMCAQSSWQMHIVNTIEFQFWNMSISMCVCVLERVWACKSICYTIYSSQWFQNWFVTDCIYAFGSLLPAVCTMHISYSIKQSLPKVYLLYAYDGEGSKAVRRLYTTL